MFDFLKLGFAEVQWVVVTAIGIYAWIINKHSASAKELLELHVRVVELENAVKDMPSKIDIARVEGEIGHTRNSRQGVAQLPLSFHGALSRSIGLQRMERGERREGCYLLIDRRVIFHRAGA